MRRRKGFKLLPLVAAVALFVLQASVLANTEIINLDASPVPSVSLPETLDWPLLEPSNAQMLLRVQPAPVDTPVTMLCEPLSRDTLRECDHETWLKLSLDAPPWTSSSKFTLRISWPAMHPVEFFIDVYSPESLSTLLHGRERAQNKPTSDPDPSLTRQRFARIRVIHGGVFTPSSTNVNGTIDAVPFIIAVEPLYLGVLPASLAPTVVFLVVLATVAGFVVYPRIYNYLFAVAERVRNDTVAAEERRKG
ncbi:hypothetical protein BN946_scf185022.g9 [Trametes cinnabarina]|uniref:Uncharacterized protein n=1 Tax=Pycnoporus cinnabarinus TaxID=5643 RepID=A0A060SRM0_PYCCI|nr:hypothetical protein BN946_scf185022.g9 [Trametes cinnabarina]